MGKQMVEISAWGWSDTWDWDEGNVKVYFLLSLGSQSCRMSNVWLKGACLLHMGGKNQPRQISMS